MSNELPISYEGLWTMHQNKNKEFSNHKQKNSMRDG